MTYSCLKTGFEPLDSIHAIGLGLLLWGTSGQPVSVEDRGLFYQLVPDASIDHIQLPAVLADLLPLTTPAELEADAGCEERAAWVLDGALAWLFTSPGVRTPSVASVRRKIRLSPQVAAAAISKWARLRTKVLFLTERMRRRIGTSAERLLAGYAPDSPQPLSFGPKPSGGLGIPLVLEPALGYAYRHPLADGEVADKVNVAALSPPLAPILLLLGSLYCTRSQEVAGRLVHFYTPIVRQATIDGQPIMPCLPATDSPSDEALMGRWIQMQLRQRGSPGTWTGIEYQILQTQGAQQSFSLGRGVLTSGPLLSPTQAEICHRWARWLAMPRAQRPPGTDDLISVILRQEAGALMTHLRMAAIAITRTKRPFWAMYREDEIREVIVMTNSTHGDSTALAEIIGRGQGTYRFGTALRGLGEYFPAVQRELIADLDIVRDSDQLLRVLARVAEQCTISAAKNSFAIIPNDDDLQILLADVDQHGARMIAGLIIILAALRYPRRQTDATAAPTESEQTISEAL